MQTYAHKYYRGSPILMKGGILLGKKFVPKLLVALTVILLMYVIHLQANHSHSVKKQVQQAGGGAFNTKNRFGPHPTDEPDHSGDRGENEERHRHQPDESTISEREGEEGHHPHAKKDHRGGNDEGQPYVVGQAEATFHQAPLGMNDNKKKNTQKEMDDVKARMRSGLREEPSDRKTNLDPRREKVLKALKHSWKGYATHALGKDEYFPISGRTNNWGGSRTGIGTTIVDALDTLLMAGLDEEADEALKWIEEHLEFNQNIKVSLFETTIRILGGLISAYEKTGKEFLKTKAVELGNRLSKAFKTPSGIPDNYVNLHTGEHSGASWNGGAAILSEFGSLQMEFYALSRITGDSSYDERARRAVEKIQPTCGGGLCSRNYINGKPAGGSAALGSFGDSFYEYLLKYWLLTGKKDKMYKQMWEKAAKHLLATSRFAGKARVPNGQETGMVMEHLACFSGGLFALSYLHTENEEHLELAKDIADTCHAMYQSQPTKLAPDVAVVHNEHSFSVQDGKYILRPETVETYFYLWKVTKDTKYRDWGEEILDACNKYLKVPNGYVGAADVQHVPPSQHDNMETFWFAETLKYLYLLFSEDEAIDLKKTVINTEAHPFKMDVAK